MASFPVQSMDTMSSLVRAMVDMEPPITRTHLPKSLTVLDLCANVEVLAAHTNTSHVLETCQEAQEYIMSNDFKAAEPITGLTLAKEEETAKDVVATTFPFNDLPAELRSKIIEMSVDNHYVSAGRRVQHVSENGANVLASMPASAAVSKQWRAETIRHLVVAQVQSAIPGGNSNAFGAVTTVVYPSGDVVFLTDRAPDTYPDNTKTILRAAKTVMVYEEALVPRDPEDSGLLAEVMLAGTTFEQLQTLNVIIQPIHNKPIVEISLNVQAFEAFVNGPLRNYIRMPLKTFRQTRVDLLSRTRQPYRRVGMEFFLPIGDRQLWTLFINTLSPLRSAWPIPMLPHEFANNIQFEHDNAEMVWQQDKSVMIREHLRVTREIFWDCLNVMSQQQGFQMQTRAAFIRDMRHRTPAMQGMVRLFLCMKDWESENANASNMSCTVAEYNTMMRATGQPEI
ncbi:hypothetical protein PFICI_09319 [Pestalotiopsis fici W106-1]|uniref:Uncharacterized protein n=1 Tax=Pestalotiopsis fici (strain W106-1 / CGMCC3.15140) TaxID=1229662 RepID=W3X2U0_PESFW|nr:uncharacterized protein PFICI_09319 [Pestalotiopsis fici W106-1]ETS79466.1 hypothetical protein PFICI_09319 [Pestalotiopsis fici W106-1]